MAELQGGQKVRVLLAQALFGHPQALLLDEPTNHLDLDSIHWLREFFVHYDGKLITHPLGEDILPGITRSVVIDIIKAQGLPFEERTFTIEEAFQAREAFITSASQVVLPVVRIDGHSVGNGAPGLITTALRRDYHRYAEIAL